MNGFCFQRKLRIRKPVSKTECRFDTESIKIAVAHIDTFPVVRIIQISIIGAELATVRIILISLCPGSGQFSGGVCFSKNHIRHDISGDVSGLADQKDCMDTRNAAQYTGINHAAYIQQHCKMRASAISCGVTGCSSGFSGSISKSRSKPSALRDSSFCAYSSITWSYLSWKTSNQCREEISTPALAKPCSIFTTVLLFVFLAFTVKYFSDFLTVFEVFVIFGQRNTLFFMTVFGVLGFSVN